MDFAVLEPSAKVFYAKFGGLIALTYGWFAICESFLHEFSLPTDPQNFSHSKVYRYTVAFYVYLAKKNIIHHHPYIIDNKIIILCSCKCPTFAFFCSQAIQLVLQYAPALTVEYCLTYLPPQLDHWKDLLTTLLDICTSHDQQGSSANPQLVETHRSLYKGKFNFVTNLEE